jgi:hypothetical protein
MWHRCCCAKPSHICLRLPHLTLTLAALGLRRGSSRICTGTDDSACDARNALARLRSRVRRESLLFTFIGCGLVWCSQVRRQTASRSPQSRHGRSSHRCKIVVVCRSVRVFAGLFVRSFVCSFFCLFVCFFVPLSVCSFVRSFVRLFVRSFVRSFICLCVCVRPLETRRRWRGTPHARRCAVMAYWRAAAQECVAAVRALVRRHQPRRAAATAVRGVRPKALCSQRVGPAPRIARATDPVACEQPVVHKRKTATMASIDTVVLVCSGSRCSSP